MFFDRNGFCIGPAWLEMAKVDKQRKTLVLIRKGLATGWMVDARARPLAVDGEAMARNLRPRPDG